MDLAGAVSFLIPAAILFFLFISGVRIINEYENGVVFRLGRYVGLKRAGFRWIIPINYLYATSQLAQTTLRAILGQAELDQLLAERDRINRELQKVLDAHTDPWGIKVSNVEVKQIDLPNEMQRAIARQAEAERERRAKVISAEGEHQAAEKLALAAAVISRDPATLQLRYLQTLVQITSSGNHTIIPIPLDLLKTLSSAPHLPALPQR